MQDHFSRFSVPKPGDSAPIDPVSLIEGDSPIIFSGPHNGLAVPGNPEKPLGMTREWFEKAHEASDLNMAALFKQMVPRFPAASFIWSNYSRLVCDTNRMPDQAIAQTSSEWEDLTIPANCPESLSEQEKESRMNAIYWPYHNALAELVKHTRQKFGTALLIDMHSFTPVWQGRHRESEIGMLTLDEQHPLAQLSCEFLTERSGLRYLNRLPYYLPDRAAITAAPLVTEKTGAPYFGFEVRNDLIADPDGREKLCGLIANYLNFLENHPHRELIFKPSVPQFPESMMIPEPHTEDSQPGIMEPPPPL